MSIIFILMAVENHFDHFEVLPSLHLRWKIIHIYVICLNCFFFSCHNSSIPISNSLSHSWFGPFRANNAAMRESGQIPSNLLVHNFQHPYKNDGHHVRDGHHGQDGRHGRDNHHC